MQFNFVFFKVGVQYKKNSLLFYRILAVWFFGFIDISNFAVASEDQQKYISVTVAISADRFVSLEKAFESVEQELVNIGLQIIPYKQEKYHMTLIGFNLAISQCLSSQEEVKLKKDIEKALNKAAHRGLKKILDHLKKQRGIIHEPIVLKFSHIELFRKHVVAIFEMTDIVQELVKMIENYFKKNIQHLVNNCMITMIKKHQDILKPHVSLAKIIKGHDLFGIPFITQNQVADFHITKPVAIISIQVRKKDTV